MGQAQKTHKDVPIPTLNSPTGALTARADGTLGLEQDLRPVRTKISGSWVPIDTTLMRGADGAWKPKSALSAITLSHGGSGALAVQDDGAGHKLTFTWPSALPTPVVNGSEAVYPNVYPGVDLELQVDPEGIRDLLVVHDAKAAANPALHAVKLGVTATGMKLTSNVHGGVEAVNTAGKTVFDGLEPRMWDSSPDGEAAAQKSTSAVTANSTASATHSAAMPVKVSGNTVEVDPDPKMLTNPSAKFPLVIDPQWYETPQNWLEMWSDGTDIWDGTVISGAGFSPYDATAVRTGYTSGKGTVRSLMQFNAFPMPQPGNGLRQAVYVTDAHLTITGQSGCPATDVWKTNSFSQSTNWSNQNSPAIWPSGSNILGTTSGSCGTSSFLDTAQITDVYAANGPTYSIGLRAHSEGTSGGYGSFYITGSSAPKMNVTFVAEPWGVATGISAAPVSNHTDNPTTTCTYDPNNPGYLPAFTGSLNTSATFGDWDSGREITYQFALNDMTTGLGAGTGGNGITHSVANSPTPGPPSGQNLTGQVFSVGSDAETSQVDLDTGTTVSTLVDGHEYQLFAFAWDDDGTLNGILDQNRDNHGGELPISPPCYFVSAQTKPAIPQVTGSTFPAAGQHLASYQSAPSSGTVTVTATAQTTPIVRFDYAINTASINEGANHCPTGTPSDACGSKSVTTPSTSVGPTAISIPADATRYGNNTVYISAVDAAGNVSWYAEYDFFLSQAYTSTVLGDVTGDGIPDVMAIQPDASGNGHLVTYDATHDPNASTGSTPNWVEAASASAAPNGSGSWTGALITHRGAERVQPLDDLFAWQRDTTPGSNVGHLSYYLDSAPYGGTDSFTKSQRVIVTRPPCTGTCQNYASNWNNVRQIVALGPVAGGCTITAPTTACKTNLLTVEDDGNGGANVWLFSPAGIGQVTNPRLIGTSSASWNWATTTIVSAGDASGHGGQMPDLLVRDSSGTLWMFKNRVGDPTGLTDTTTKIQIGAPAQYAGFQGLASAGDIAHVGVPALYGVQANGQVQLLLGSGSGASYKLTTPAAFSGGSTTTVRNWTSATSVSNFNGSTLTTGNAGPLVSGLSSGSGQQYCLDDLSAGWGGNPVDIAGCRDATGQNWIFQPDGTLRWMGHTDSNGAYDQCLNTGGAVIVGAPVQLAACVTAPAATGAQIWQILPGAAAGQNALYNPQAGLCLEDPNGSTAGTVQLQLAICAPSGTAKQSFVLPGSPRQTQSLEAESISYSYSGATPSVQTNCCGATWSNGEQLLAPNTAATNGIGFQLYVANTGTYQITPIMTQATDYGIVTASVDGTPMPNQFDGYHSTVRTTPFTFGSISLTAGIHNFTFKTNSTNASSTGNRYTMGIDRIDLVPATGTAPNAVLAATPTSGAAPLTVTASAAGSTPGSASIASYTFDFGDGTIVGPQASPTASHQYTSQGNYTLALTVTDSTTPTPQTSTTTENIAVAAPTPPTAALSAPASIPIYGTATANASGSTPGSSTITSYSFDFGDGTVVGPQSTATATHVYTAYGYYNVTVTVTDAYGMTATATSTVYATCPCSVFQPGTDPAAPDSGDPTSVELGMKIQPLIPGNITGVRFYKSSSNTGTHTGSLWTIGGTQLATGTFTGETASGWQTLTFANPVPVQAGMTYVVSYHAPNGHYAYTAGYFTSNGAGQEPLTSPQDGPSGPNGLYNIGSSTAFPATGNNGANYWVDAIFDTAGVPTTAPTVTPGPASGATGVATTAAVTAAFSAAIDPNTLSFTLTDGSGAQVPASFAYNSSTKTATLTPGTQLPTSTTFTASVQATDVWGNAMTAPYTWSFTTGSTTASYTCPCSLFSGTATPAIANSGDTDSAELGVRFTPSANGHITGIRFYKGSLNTGTHTGTLWSSTGTQLATGTFTGETASGWQTLTFSSPVAVTAGTTYIASYHAPVGEYSDDTGYFTYQHITSPLTAPASTSTNGNGLYVYGSSTTFPTNSRGGTNYWVDVIFGP